MESLLTNLPDRFRVNPIRPATMRSRERNRAANQPEPESL